MNSLELALALAREANRQWVACTKGSAPHGCPNDEQLAAAFMKIIEEFNKSK